jgi:hypothetical protein
MKNFNFLIIGLFVLIISCSKNSQDDLSAYAGATVLGKGTDCGNSFLIKFDDDVTGLPENFDHIFYEINLPDEYKIEGKKIKVLFREPEPNEMMACTTMGISYPEIFIIKVR